MPLSEAGQSMSRNRFLLLMQNVVDYNNYLKNLAPNLIGLWPLTDASGNALDISGNGFNGTYDADAVKGGDTFPLGQAVVSLPGNGAIGLPTASLETLFSWQEYSLILWVKMPVANWASDTTAYYFLGITTTGSAQRFQIRKNQLVPGELTCILLTGASLKQPTVEGLITPDWTQIGVTYSKIADETKLFINRNQGGATLTGLGTDGGSVITTAAIGAFDAVGASGMVGGAAFCALYHDTILTQAQFQASYDLVVANYVTATKNIIGSGDSTWTGEGATTGKLMTNLGAGYGFVREMGVPGYTSTNWQSVIDAQLLANTFNRAPSFIITNIGKNDMSSMPSQATFEANIAYVYDAIHTKYPSTKIVIEVPWRVGKTTEANTLKGYVNNVIATRSWATIGTDETGYFATAEGATPGSYSSDGIHIDTVAGVTDRASRLATAIAAL